MKRVTFLVEDSLLVQARKKLPMHGDMSAFLRACIFILARTDMENVKDIVDGSISKIKRSEEGGD